MIVKSSTVTVRDSSYVWDPATTAISPLIPVHRNYVFICRSGSMNSYHVIASPNPASTDGGGGAREVKQRDSITL